MREDGSPCIEVNRHTRGGTESQRAGVCYKGLEAEPQLDQAGVPVFRLEQTDGLERSAQPQCLSHHIRSPVIDIWKHRLKTISSLIQGLTPAGNSELQESLQCIK